MANLAGMRLLCCVPLYGGRRHVTAPWCVSVHASAMNWRFPFGAVTPLIVCHVTAPWCESVHAFGAKR